MKNDIICWFSGGITSAVAILKAVDIYGIDRCRFVFIDTFNEHEDTYRFKKDLESHIKKEIETISMIGDNGKYQNITDVWRKYNSLNVAHGAICSTELKRKARTTFEKENEYTHQVFGFEANKRELQRSLNMKNNNPSSKPIFPLLMFGMDKKDCIKYIESLGITIPMAYSLGFENNNCLNTGCVQGGIGYWQKIQRDMPEQFLKMAKLEHELTDNKGLPVTMLKDQTKEAKESGIFNVFLLPHPKFPMCKSLSDMKGREPKPLTECNGFCGTNDLLPKEDTEYEIFRANL